MREGLQQHMPHVAVAHEVWNVRDSSRTTNSPTMPRLADFLKLPDQPALTRLQYNVQPATQRRTKQANFRRLAPLQVQCANSRALTQQAMHPSQESSTQRPTGISSREATDPELTGPGRPLPPPVYNNSVQTSRGAELLGQPLPSKPVLSFTLISLILTHIRTFTHSHSLSFCRFAAPLSAKPRFPFCFQALLALFTFVYFVHTVTR